MKRMVDYVISILFDQYQSGGDYISLKLMRNLRRNITIIWLCMNNTYSRNSKLYYKILVNMIKYLHGLEIVYHIIILNFPTR